MKNEKNRRCRKICLIVGSALLAVAVIALVLWQFGLRSSEKRLEYYVNALHSSIPTPKGAIIEERRDNAMSALSVDGIDFVGILEFPSYESELPVCANWGKPSKYPCRFNGSVYDRSLQIGSTTQRGQYDFYRELSVGDRLFFTDMEGNRFSYEITNIKYAKNADRSTLESENSALTLFVKNVYGFEYIIIYCDTLN